MINADQNFPVETREAQTFDPIPENIYQVELLDVEMELRAKYKKPEEKENQLSFQFVILSGKDKEGNSLRGRNIWFNFVPIYFYEGEKGKNKLFQVIEALLGRELTREEIATFETGKINKLITKQCRVFVKNTTKGDKIYSNIDSLLTAESLLTSLTTEEKEKAKIKSKENQQVGISNEEMSTAESEINVENIRF
jgi:hypothetical protein